MTTPLNAERLTRPIIGIENRTPLEVFDIMADRIRSALVLSSAPPVPAQTSERDDALEEAAKAIEPPRPHPNYFNGDYDPIDAEQMEARWFAQDVAARTIRALKRTTPEPTE